MLYCNINVHRIITAWFVIILKKHFSLILLVVHYCCMIVHIQELSTVEATDTHTATFHVTPFTNYTFQVKVKTHFSSYWSNLSSAALKTLPACELHLCVHLCIEQLHYLQILM
jgi:hypothetical protein